MQSSRLVRVLYRISVVGFWFSVAGGVAALAAVLFLGRLDVTTTVHGLKLPDGLHEPTGGIQVMARIDHPDVSIRILIALFFIAAIALFAVGLRLVRGVLGSVKAGDPFVVANVRRLRRLGVLFIASPLVVSVLLATATTEALPESVRNMATLHFGVPLTSWIAAGLLFVLAEVFAHGVRLREDVEGTV